MTTTWLVLLLLPFTVSFNHDPEERLDLRGIIERWDYPVEVHEVTTKDGYILDLHRIPRGQNESKMAVPCVRPAVLLNHGFVSSGAQWALNLPNQSAAFVFADAGFDVYLANHRGTTYGRKHVNKNPKGLFTDFWQFTLDEMANLDLPAIIDKVLELSGNKELYYVGHSQGNLIGFLTFADNPQYNKKIKKFFALTPAGAAHYARGVTQFAFLAHNVLRPLTALYTSVLGAHKIAFGIIPVWLFRLVGEIFCKNAPLNYICKDFIELSSGPTGPHLNTTRIPVYFSHFPAGSSTWTFLHYAQNAQAKKPMHFDYGNALKNLQKHGRIYPHPYNYSQINTELYLYWSRNDWLATPQDIEKLLVPSLRRGIIKGSFEIPEYNHLDFALATTTRDRLYRPIIEIIHTDDPLPMCVMKNKLMMWLTVALLITLLSFPFVQLTQLALTTIGLILAYVIYRYYKFVSHFPKGPFPLPFVGNLNQFDRRRLDKTLDRFGKEQHGLYTVFMPFPVVQITDYDILREAFIEKGKHFSMIGSDEFVNRPLSPLFQEAFCFSPNTGVIQSNGDTWREQRRAAISIMRDFGMGKNVMEGLVQASISEFMEHLDKLPDKSNIDLYWPIKVLVANVINEVLFGYRYAYDDCDSLMNYVNRFNDVIESSAGSLGSALGMAFPILNKIPWIRWHILGRITHEMREINEYIVENVERAVKDYSVDDDPACFAHACKQRMAENENLEDDCDYTEMGHDHHGEASTRAGNEFSTDTLRGEIHAVVGRDRLPTMADQIKMVYARACVLELHRFANVLSVNVQRATVKDVQIRGHIIPAGTWVNGDIHYLMANDPVFVNSSEFRPERYLTDDRTTLRKDLVDRTLPFSLGKRVCAGEGLARVEIFLGLTTIVQQYRILPLEGEEIDLNPIVTGAFQLPKPQRLRLEKVV